MSFHALRLSAVALGATGMALTLGVSSAYAWTHSSRHYQRHASAYGHHHRYYGYGYGRYHRYGYHGYRYAPLAAGVVGAEIAAAAMTPYDCAYGYPSATYPGAYCPDYGYYTYPGYGYDYAYGWPVAAIGFGWGWGPNYYGDWSGGYWGGHRRWRSGWRGNRWAGGWGGGTTVARTGDTWVGSHPGFGVGVGGRPIGVGGTAWAAQGLGNRLGATHAASPGGRAFANMSAARPAGFGSAMGGARFAGGGHFGRVHVH